MSVPGPITEDRILEVISGPSLRRFLGPRDPAEQLAHALGFADVVVEQLGGPPPSLADLGTGGGVPGLVLAALWSDCEAALIESRVRRCEALERATVDLGIAARTRVLAGRAEVWARTGGIRESFDLVTARSFARPAVTAEIAAGLARVGATVVVSDPPDPDPGRWPIAQLSELGLGPARLVVARGFHFACLPKLAAAPSSVPGPAGRLEKRPRW